MTNQEFIEFVVRDKKVPYDNNLLTDLLYRYFLSAIETLEKSIDFNYMERSSIFTVLANQYEIKINEIIKKIATLIDKTHNFELYGDDDASVFYLLFQDKPAIPNRFVVSNNTIRLTTPVKENTDYVIRYYIYTYKDNNYIGLDKTHPLIEENFQLLLTTLGSYIDRYYSTQSDDIQFSTAFSQLEKNAQQQKRRITAMVRFDYERY